VLAKEKETPEEIKSKLLAQNKYGQTALNVAAECSVAVMERLWVFVKIAQLNQEELQNKLLLAKDKYGHTAWLKGAQGGSSKALEILWNCAKEAKLNQD